MENEEIIKYCKEVKIDGVEIQYNSQNIHIVNSYLVNSKSKMFTILTLFKKMTNYKSKRTIKSWIKEWKAHNRLYRFGFFKSHTKDCDLEENEKLYRLIAYQILGI